MKKFLLAASLISTLRFPRANTLETQKIEIDRLTGELTAANTAKEKAELDFKNEKEAHGKTTESLASAQGDVSRLTGELATANATIATRDGEITTLKAASVTVEQAAQQLLASQGHQPLKITADPDTVEGSAAKGSLIEQYNALQTEPERTAFAAKHKGKL